MPSKLPNYKGKVLSISLSTDDMSHDLLNPVFETINGTKFITGIVPKGASCSNWTEGAKNSIAWENITEFTVFNSLAEYSKAIKLSEDYDNKNKK